MNQWLLIISLSSFTLISTKAIPVIDVSEESLCPDCHQFLVNSFNDFVNYKVKDLAVVNLIPYGNANEKFVDGKWVFTCQHKENECYGNLIETCMIHVMGRVNSYKPIICINKNIMSYKKKFDKTLSYCVKNTVVLNQIKACVKSDLGNKLQHEMALKTPKDHKYVPWITVDGVHDPAVEEKILTNMIEYLCSLPQSDCKKEAHATKSPSNAINFLSDSKCYA